jgi:hypothetical protein
MLVILMVISIDEYKLGPVQEWGIFKRKVAKSESFSGGKKPSLGDQSGTMKKE